MKTTKVLNRERHPCFNFEARNKFGRVHLPVAPKCNIQCNFCNRKYSCVNESRPGVTSTVLSPSQADIYFDMIIKKIPEISVMGIAGPGDAFANVAETLETMRRVKEKYPFILFCLSGEQLIGNNSINKNKACKIRATFFLKFVVIFISGIYLDIKPNINK